MNIVITLFVILFTATMLALLEEREQRIKDLEKLDQGESEEI